MKRNSYSVFHLIVHIMLCISLIVQPVLPFWRVSLANAALLANVPSSFYKSSPANGATDLSSDATLSWSASSGATEYGYCVDTTDDEACDGGESGYVRVSETSVRLDLLPDTTYYWQVRAYNADGLTSADGRREWLSFTTGAVRSEQSNQSSSDPRCFSDHSDLPMILGSESNDSPLEGENISDRVCGLGGDDTVNGNGGDDFVNGNMGEDVVNGNQGDDHVHGGQNDDTVRGGQDNDMVYGDRGDDTLYGDFGNDSLFGGPDNDTFYYRLGDGDDIISDCEGSNELILTQIDSSLVSYQQQGNDRLVRINSSTSPGSVKIEDYHNGCSLNITTESGEPNSFNKIGPTNGASNQPNNVMLSWSAASGATSYRYCIDTTNDDACPGGSAGFILAGGTSVTPDELLPDTTYYWQVRAHNADGDTPADGVGAWWSFTTAPASATPDAFNKTGPTNGATNVANNTTLSWQPSNGATTYGYCIHSDSTRAQECPGYDSGYERLDETSVTLNLQPDTTYYWQVRAYNGAGHTPANGFAGWWRFTTGSASGLPNAFSKSGPQDGATDVATNVTLSWNASNGATRYGYCLNRNPNNACEGGDRGYNPVNGTSTTLSLDPGTTYYWQVRAYNDAGYTPANGVGGWWRFTTAALSTQPSAFNKSGPVNGAINVPNNTTLTWSAATNTVNYGYCIHDDSTRSQACPGGAEGYTLVAGTRKTLNLQPETTYYWQVRAYNGMGDYTPADRAGEWMSFTTAPASSLPDVFYKSSPSNGATDQPTNMTLSWDASDGVTQYGYCIDRVNDNACADGDAGYQRLNGTSKTLSLSPGTTYYWQVRAYNGNGYMPANGVGQWWSFTTEGGQIAGYTPGEFGTNEAGAANYKIPLVVPPGTGGMAPELALAYDSRGANSLVGWGWSLAGLSMIARCPNTLAQHGFVDGIDFDGNDQFCLDGQLLVAVQGSYGKHGTVYTSENQTFAKVVSYGEAGDGPQRFKVWTKAGLIMEYGYTADSRIEAQDRTEALYWGVNRIEDTKGNYLTINYHEDNARGEAYPVYIDYTGNSSQGLVPYSSVQFRYEGRPDVSTNYVGGSAVNISTRLQAVRMLIDGDLVREYRLGYDISAGTGRSRLVNVTECAWDGACLPASNFDWQEGGNSSLFQAVDNLSGIEGKQYWDAPGHARILTGDFNGNGKTDIVNIQQDGNHWMGLSNGNGSFQAVDQLTGIEGKQYWDAPGNAYILTGDFNGDGKSDIVNIQQDGNHWMGLSNGDGSFQARDFLTGIEGKRYWEGAGNAHILTGDFNGDGKSDIINIQQDGNDWMGLSNGDGSFQAIDFLTGIEGKLYWDGLGNAEISTGDFNGDGLTDVINIQRDGNHWMGLSNGDGSFQVVNQLGEIEGREYWLDNSFILSGDFNGDGLTDVINIQQDGNDWMGLSNGNGSFQLVDYLTGIEGKPYWNGDGNTAIRIGDFNADGKTDVINIQRDGNHWMGISNGDGSFQPIDQLGGIEGHQYWHNNSFILIGDFNGNGKTGVINIQQDGNDWMGIASGAFPDLLTKITNGNGVQIKVGYQPLTDPAIYSKDNDATYPRRDFQSPLYVVASHSSSNGIGGERRMSYKYAGLKINMRGRGFLGFRWIKAFDEETGISTTTYYSQQHPYKSLVLKTEQHLANGTLISSVENQWAVLSYDQYSVNRAPSANKRSVAQPLTGPESWKIYLPLTLREEEEEGTPTPTATATPLPNTTPIPTATSTPTGADTALQLLVPLYIYPDSSWDDIVTASSQVPITAIINPASGPGDLPIPAAYVEGLNKLRNANNVTILGYVHTQRGDRDETLVKQEIDRYDEHFDIDGIFFDEMAADLTQEKLNYYQELYNYVDTRQNLDQVFLNPGGYIDPQYLDQPVGETAVIFEGRGSDWSNYTPQSYVAEYSAEQFAFLAYNVPNVSAMQDHLRLAVERNVSYVYVTDDIWLNKNDNPWDTLPSFWQEMVDHIELLNQDAPSTPTPTPTVTPTVTPTETPPPNALQAARSSAATLSALRSPNTTGVSYFPYVRQSVVKKYELDGSMVSATTTDTQYDSYGNPTLMVVSYSDGYAQTTKNTYINNHEKWFLGRLTQSEVTAEASGQPVQTRTSTFAYDAQSGLLIEEEVEPGTSLLLSKRYQHDGYGNIIRSTVDGPDIEARSESTEYNGRGRFAIKSTNALGHSENREHDKRFGTLTKLTGPNGIVTTWGYDGFGRVTLEHRADGTQTTTSYRRCEANCPSGVIYYVTTEASGAAPVVEYYDILDRAIRQESVGFDGRAIYVETEYDQRGQTKRASEPYFSNETPLWSQYTYDDLGRVLTEIFPDGSSTAADYQGLTTRSTNPLNQVNTRTVNSQGQLVRSTDAQNHAILYTYDGFGNLLEMVDSAGNSTTMEYDLRGRKTSMTDPDMGATTYRYNAIGELVRQQDAKNQVVTLTYDVLGRMIERRESEGTSRWTYDTHSHAIGKLATVSGPNGYAERYLYDEFGRPSESTTTIEDENYPVRTTYDQYSRVDTVTYPTGFAIKNVYNEHGYLSEVRRASDNTLYWQANAINARGQIETESLGNQLATNRRYDAQRGYIDTIQTTRPNNSTVVQYLAYDFDRLGNLVSRSDNQQNRSETFQYDSLNRLTRATVSGQPAKTAQYDELGNLTFRSDVGSYTYSQNGAGPHAVTSISGASSNTYNYDANGNRISSSTGSIAYTSFNLPEAITEGNNEVTFAYGPDHNRYKKEVNNNGTIVTTIYIGGLYEIERSATQSQVTHKHYISNGNGAIAIFIRELGESERTLYLHKDHLGSIDTITDDTGNVVERLSYDAWGKRRNADWSDATTTLSSQVNRGFTGHEQLDEVGLIHMNGRVYDPQIGRFLSADPFVQAPDNTQSLNRYSYVLNNPLSFTDSTGFFLDGLVDWFKDNWRSVVAAVVTIATGGWASGVLVPFLGFATISASAAIVAGATAGFVGGVAGTLLYGGSLSQALKAGLRGAVIGGLSAGAFYGVGEVFGHAFNPSTYAPKILAHGVVGGLREVAQGGKFEHGFYSAAFNAAFAPTGTTGSDTMDIVVSAIVGGTAAELGGGKFANGAVTAAFARMFNEQMNKEKGKTKSITFYDENTKEIVTIHGPLNHEQAELFNSYGTEQGVLLGVFTSVAVMRLNPSLGIGMVLAVTHLYNKNVPNVTYLDILVTHSIVESGKVTYVAGYRVKHGDQDYNTYLQTINR